MTAKSAANMSKPKTTKTAVRILIATVAFAVLVVGGLILWVGFSLSGSGAVDNKAVVDNYASIHFPAELKLTEKNVQAVELSKEAQYRYSTTLSGVAAASAIASALQDQGFILNKYEPGSLYFHATNNSKELFLTVTAIENDGSTQVNIHAQRSVKDD